MRVLIIDDHPLFQEALVATLKQVDLRIRVDAASSAAEALALLEKGKPYRLITLDLSMPGLDGLAFLRILTQQSIETPVVVISASDDVKIMYECIEAGALGFIPKSYRMPQLSSAIETVLNGEQYLPEEASAMPSKHDDEVQRIARCGELGLSKKHYSVLCCMADGMTNKQISAKLYISIHTVKAHNAKIFETLHTSNRTDTVMEAIRLGLIKQ